MVYKIGDRVAKSSSNKNRWHENDWGKRGTIVDIAEYGGKVYKIVVEFDGETEIWNGISKNKQTVIWAGGGYGALSRQISKIKPNAWAKYLELE